MSHDVGVWIDHKKAVIVSIAAGQGQHPHYAGVQEGGREKKPEERAAQGSPWPLAGVVRAHCCRRELGISRQVR
jgi:hypothetical protein